MSSEHPDYVTRGQLMEAAYNDGLVRPADNLLKGDEVGSGNQPDTEQSESLCACGRELALDQDADTGETFLVCMPCHKTYPIIAEPDPLATCTFDGIPAEMRRFR